MNHREVHLIRRRALAFDLDGTLATTSCRASVSIVCLLGQGAGDVRRLRDLRRSRLFPVRAPVDPSPPSDPESAWLGCIDDAHLPHPRLPPRQLRRVVGPAVRGGPHRARQATQQRGVERGACRLGYWESAPHGATIEDRGSQITFSALGQDAPPALKCAWDPGGVKKEALRLYTAEELPDLEVRAGGTTSIDITRHGVDKAYGMRRLMTVLDVRASEVVYFGDQLDEGGNDHPVRAWSGSTRSPCAIRASTEVALAAIIAVAT